jgi:hypothetical protein
MIAVHIENLIFLLFIVIALLFQLLTRAAGAANKNSDEESEPEPPLEPRPPTPRPRRLTDEERIREFLEALGQPTTSKPPARVQPRPTYQKPVVLPHVPPLASPLPPLTTRPPDLPREIRLPGQIPSTRGTKVFTPKAAEPPPFEVHETQTPLESPPAMTKSAAEPYAAATQQTAAPQQTQTHFATLLRSTSALRDAIVLREIFGPPRSLQPLELTNII